MLITFPYIMRSEANHAGNRWGHANRTAKARELATFYVRRELADTGEVITFPCVVTLTRISPRQMDDGNLSMAFKAIQDGTCDALLPANAGNQYRRWADDSDGQIIWLYAQRRGEPKENAVEIKIVPRGPIE